MAGVGCEQGDGTNAAGAAVPAGQGASGGTGRIGYLDWGRALGCLAIVFLHVLVTTRLNGDLPSARYAVTLWVDTALTRWGVPVFLMISGALLLNPQKEMGLPKLRRYVVRMVCVRATIGFAMAIIESALDAGALSLAVVGEAALHVLEAKSWGHLWYLYALIGLYLLTPLFRAFTAHASRQEMRFVLMACVALVMAVPTANIVFDLELTTFYVTLPAAAVYYLLGYYAHTYLSFNRRWAVAGIACALGAAALAVLLYYLQGNATPAYEPEDPLICVYSVAVFLGLRRFLGGVPMGEHPLFRGIANLSFAIYLVHTVFQHLFVRLVPVAAVPPVAYEAAMFVVSLAGSVAVAWLLKRLPGFRRWL